MRTLLLGSSGFFGSVTAKLLADQDCFGELVLASRDIEKISDLSRQLGERTSCTTVDMLDDESLHEAIEGCQLVVNAAGATLETAVPAMRAAAAAGVSYCDIAAESDVLIQAERFEDEFSKSGATILVGAGFHPGVTDLLGVKAIDGLDEVDGVDFFIVGNFPDYGDPDSMLGMLDTGWEGTEGLKTVLAGIGLPATIIENKERRIVEPWTNAFSKKTPDGVSIDFTYFSTSEPVALNRSRHAIANSAMYYGAWPNSINSVIKDVAPEAATGKIHSGAALKSVFKAARTSAEGAPTIHFWAEAKGKAEGKIAKCIAYSTQPWATNARMIATTTGVLAFAAEKLAKNSIEKKGLVTAGEVLEPNEVFRRIAGSEDAEVVTQLTY